VPITSARADHRCRGPSNDLGYLGDGYAAILHPAPSRMLWIVKPTLPPHAFLGAFPCLIDAGNWLGWVSGLSCDLEHVPTSPVSLSRKNIVLGLAVGKPLRPRLQGFEGRQFSGMIRRVALGSCPCRTGCRHLGEVDPFPLQGSNHILVCASVSITRTNGTSPRDSEFKYSRNRSASSSAEILRSMSPRSGNMLTSCCKRAHAPKRRMRARKRLCSMFTVRGAAPSASRAF
jgi:hypothetical protein